VAAIEQVRVQKQGLALANELLRQNQGKFKVGALPRTAVLEAQSEVARREANLILFQNLETVARDNLRAIVNSPSPEAGAGALTMITPADKPTVTPYPIDLDRSLKNALEERPELVAARLNVNSQGLQRMVAANKLLPRLDVVGTLGVNGTSGGRATTAFGPDVSKCTVNASGVVSCPPAVFQANPSLEGGYANALEMLYDGRFYNYSAGLAVEIPLGNSQAKADYAASNVTFEQAKLSLQSLEESITLEVKQAVSNLDTAFKSIDARRIARELAEENLRNQQARYDVGLATTKDLLDYQDRLTQAQATEVLALTQYNSDLAELRRDEGTLLAARNVSVERTATPQIPWWEKF
jgi:outer membrane protein